MIPLESAKLDAENLFHLLDLMSTNSKELQGEHLDRLLGLAFNLSNDIQQWFEQESKRREQLN